MKPGSQAKPEAKSWRKQRPHAKTKQIIRNSNSPPLQNSKSSPPKTNTSTLTNKPFAHLPTHQSTDMKMMSSNPGSGKGHSMIGMPPDAVASKESAYLTIGNTRYGRKTILLVLLGVVAVTAGLT
jgi:hypothetical protein